MKVLNLAILALTAVDAGTIPNGSTCTKLYGFNSYTTNDCESSSAQCCKVECDAAAATRGASIDFTNKANTLSDCTNAVVPTT